MPPPGERPIALPIDDFPALYQRYRDLEGQMWARDVADLEDEDGLAAFREAIRASGGKGHPGLWARRMERYFEIDEVLREHGEAAADAVLDQWALDLESRPTRKYEDRSMKP